MSSLKSWSMNPFAHPTSRTLKRGTRRIRADPSTEGNRGMNSSPSPTAADAPKVFVPGGAGYVGAVLVPSLLEAGYRVRVLDLYLYGAEPLAAVRGHPD